MDPMAVVSLQKCSFEGRPLVARVWFDGSERSALLVWLWYHWDDDDWFAFVRELDS